MSKQEKAQVKKAKPGPQKPQTAQSKGKQAKTPKVSNVDNNEDVKRDQKLQAVLFAENFLNHSIPFAAHHLNQLHPLINIPVIDYTFEFLLQSGVEEVILFCVSDSEIIQGHLDKSKWSSLLSVKCITSPFCKSEGDALRELDVLNIVRSDPFVLMSGGVISNVNLKSAIAFHKLRRTQDINNVMTVTLRRVNKHSTTKPALDDLVVSLDKRTSQLLLFDNNLSNGLLSIPVDLMEQHSDMAFETDLLDCHIDICSPEFLLQFSDNFDYQNVRKDFIQSEVSNWSLGKHIYGHIVEKEYAARFDDPRSFHAISRDLVDRWVYPIVPDSLIIDDNSRSVHQLGNYVYKSQNAVISRSADVGAGVFLGSRTVVHDSAHVAHTVVGNNCDIGAKARVLGSNLFANVRVESGAQVISSTLCENVSIGSGSVISSGCVIAKGVVIPPNQVVAEKTHVISIHDDASLLTKIGFTMVLKAGELLHYRSTQTTRSSRSRQSVMDRPADEEDEDEDLSDDEQDGGALDAGQPRPNGGGGENWRFAAIIREMVVTGYAEGHPADSLLMEVKGCKFAQNLSYSDCLEGVVAGLVHIAETAAIVSGQFKSTDFLTKWKSLAAAKKGWGSSLLRPLIQDTREQLKIIVSIEDSVLVSENASVLIPLFRFILQVLYEEDILTNEGVLSWIALRSREQLDPKEEDALHLQLFQGTAVQAFVAWIQADDDDDDDDEDEDSSDGSDDENDDGSEDGSVSE